MAGSNIVIPIKVLVHKQEDRFLFAEANSDFVDILFIFLTMPMGTITRLLSKNSDSSQPPAIGSFINIYRNIANLDNKYFAMQRYVAEYKKFGGSRVPKVKINIDDITPVGYYICDDIDCSGYLSFYKNVKFEKCFKFLNRAVIYYRPVIKRIVGGQEGVFVSGTASFVITDDLRAIPNIPASTFAILESFRFTDFEEFEVKTLNIGLSEILDLLKYVFMSNYPLSALFLGKNYPRTEKAIQTINLAVSADIINGFKKMTVRVLVQKSRNSILLAFGSKDFVEFLFNLLTVPVGRVISLLREYCTPALCVENIHQSVSDLNVGDYFKSKETKDMLLCPQLAMLCGCSNQLIPLREERIQKFHLYKKYTPPGQGCYESPYLTRDSASANQELKLASQLCDDVLLTGSSMFMVTDDLVITPLSSMYCIKYLQSNNISPTDTVERVTDIGMKEAVNLLRASLISTSVLRNDLQHLLLKKPKTE